MDRDDYQVSAPITRLVTKPCSECNGKGRVQTENGTCQRCGGRGYVLADSSENGLGRVPSELHSSDAFSLRADSASDAGQEKRTE